MRRFVLYILVILSLESLAFGHAIVLSATPAPNEVVKGPDISVKLQFNSRIDTKRSRLTLVAKDGKQFPLVILKAVSPDLLLSQMKDLKPGSYVLRWQVLAGDGHITRGEVPFRVQTE